jgi:TonB family protein
VEPPKPEEQKFVKEEAPTQKPPEKAPAPAPISTSIKGDAPSGLAAGNGNGTGFGTGFGNGGGGSKYGYYAGQVQSRVAEILRTDRKTRSAVMDHVKVRIWADATGRISKVSLGQSTGDPALDNAIRNEVFSNITLQEPPPEGMPMPIVMSFTARRPN